MTNPFLTAARDEINNHNTEARDKFSLMAGKAAVGIADLVPPAAAESFANGLNDLWLRVQTDGHQALATFTATGQEASGQQPRNALGAGSTTPGERAKVIVDTNPTWGDQIVTMLERAVNLPQDQQAARGARSIAMADGTTPMKVDPDTRQLEVAAIVDLKATVKDLQNKLTTAQNNDRYGYSSVLQLLRALGYTGSEVTDQVINNAVQQIRNLGDVSSLKHQIGARLTAVDTAVNGLSTSRTSTAVQGVDALQRALDNVRQLAQ